MPARPIRPDKPRGCRISRFFSHLHIINKHTHTHTHTHTLRKTERWLLLLSVTLGSHYFPPPDSCNLPVLLPSPLISSP